MSALLPRRTGRDEETRRQLTLCDRRLRFWSLPNQVTAARTLVSIPLFMWCVLAPSWTLLGLGWAVFWVGDMLDGLAARSLDLESRAGAVFDSVCDRVSMAGLLAAVAAVTGWWSVWSSAFMVLFCLVDLVVSLGFLRTRLLSPIYFWLVDPVTWSLNWHPVAKAGSLAPFVVISMFESTWLAAIYCVVYLSVKVYSLGRISTLGPLGSGANESEEPRDPVLAADLVRAPLGRPLHPVSG